MHYVLRKDEILEILRRYQYVTVNFLAEALHISASSIRRDLAVLEARGLVKRSHGGVRAIEDGNALVPFPMRVQENSIAKRAICQKAAALIRDGDILFVDNSTTCLYLPEFLGDKRVTVLTNNLKLIEMLQDNDRVTVYCAGGQVRAHGELVTTGPLAEYACRTIHTDLMFFSAKAVDDDGVITDINEPETALRQVAIAHTKRAVFLCDRSKCGTRSTFAVCRMDEIDCMITEETP